MVLWCSPSSAPIRQGCPTSGVELGHSVHIHDHFRRKSSTVLAHRWFFIVVQHQVFGYALWKPHEHGQSYRKRTGAGASSLRSLSALIGYRPCQGPFLVPIAKVIGVEDGRGGVLSSGIHSPRNSPPRPVIKHWMPRPGQRIDQLNSRKIAVHDVDIVEVWRRGLVHRAAPFVVQATSTG
jgi:hypothetical protein